LARSVSSPLDIVHALAAWRDSEAYFRSRARSGKPFGMAIPSLGYVLFATRSDHVREFLAVPAATFTPPMPNPIAPVVGEGSIILLHGERHRQERARFLPALHGVRIRRYADVMAQAARDEIADWRPGAVVDARDAAQSITLQIIIRAVFGVEDKDRCDDYVRVVKAMMRAYIAPFMFLPSLRRAPFGLGPWPRFLRLRAELDAMLADQITRRRRTGTDGYDDVLSVLLSDDQNGSRSDDYVQQQLRTLLVSGHETTATTLAWALYHIHRNDGVRSRLLEELAARSTIERRWRSCPTWAR
jgi:cytochrome P450 family 110